MTVIPAQVAGVPTYLRRLPQPHEILGTAQLLGLRNVFRMGGAQAIAALAFGTESVPRVDRIVGPGNIYVAAAKKLMAGEIGIDFVAGPTEICHFDRRRQRRVIAADMLAQAEHDVDASAHSAYDFGAWHMAVQAAIEKQLRTLPTAGVARPSIDRNGAIILVPDLQTGIELCESHSLPSI